MHKFFVKILFMSCCLIIKVVEVAQELQNAFDVIFVIDISIIFF